jgi:uncharacterized protein
MTHTPSGETPPGESEARAIRPLALSDDATVASHLRTHPDFLRRHPDLLDVLDVPHAAGPAVSLIEHQAARLRARLAELQTRLDEVIAAAARNDSLYERLVALAAELPGARDCAAVGTRVLAALRAGYGAEHVALVLFEPLAGPLPTGMYAGADPQPYAAVMAAPGSTCLAAPAARGHAGALGLAPDALGSAAALPLRAPGPLGVILLGSPDRRRFHPELGTEFLDRLARLVAAHLAVRLGATA